MIPFATVALIPDGVLAWGVVALLAGFFAGVVLKPGKCGVTGDLCASLTGAVLGGALVGMVVGGMAGLLGSIVVAALGACAAIAVLRAAVPATPQL